MSTVVLETKVLPLFSAYLFHFLAQAVKKWLVLAVYKKWMGIEIEKNESSNIEDCHYSILEVEYLLASAIAVVFFGTVLREHLWT